MSSVCHPLLELFVQTSPISSGDSFSWCLVCESPSRSTYCALGDAPLHAAAAGGHSLVVRALLKRGADAAQEGYLGWTALYVYGAAYFLSCKIIGQ